MPTSYYGTLFQSESLAELWHLCDEEDVDDLENAERVENEKGDKPPLLIALRRKPERKAFPKETPRDHKQEGPRPGWVAHAPDAHIVHWIHMRGL